MKFQKKPVVIEAFQYDGDLMDSDGKYYVPDWAVKAHKEGQLFYGTYRSGDKELPGALFVKTLEGDMYVNVGSYVIQGVDGEIYACKPSIFHQTHEAYGEGKERRMGGPGIRSYEEKLQDLLTNESYEPVEWHQSNEEVDGMIETEVTFKFKQPTPEKE